MASQSLSLRRTSYTDPSQPTNPTRQGAVQDGEALVDFTRYEKPLEQIHGSNLHGWGVASGLTVTATLGGPNLQVLPGVAIDGLGQHISLAFGGFAQSTANPDRVGDTTRLPVTNPTGVTIPTPAPGGSMYLTIQFLESFDLDSLINHGVYQMYHTPWLQLVPTAGFVNDGTSLVLAQVTIDGAGHVTSLAPGLRQGTSLPLQRVSVGNYGLVSAGGTSIGASVPEIGALLPRTAGGLTIQADTLGIQSTMGTESVFFDVVGGHAHVTGNLVVDGKLNGRDISADGGNLDAHVANHSNPHQVTPAQISALPIQGGTLSGSLNINQGLSVTNDLTVHGTITGSLAANLVGADQIQSNAVTGDKIHDSTIRCEKLAPHGGFLITCYDFFIGGTGLPGRSTGWRRALVDTSNALYVNYGPDWQACIVNNFAHGSSATMKDGIVDITTSQAEELLYSLRPRSFRFKGDQTGAMRHGFVAEEAPEGVATGEKTGVFLDGIIASLVVVVTGLQERVRELERRLSAAGDPGA